MWRTAAGEYTGRLDLRDESDRDQVTLGADSFLSDALEYASSSGNPRLAFYGRSARTPHRTKCGMDET